MKLRVIIPILLSSAGLSFAAYGEEKQSDIAADKKFIGQLMNEYATIAGGWYLEQKCHFLAGQVLKEYETRISFSTVGLNSVVGIDKKLLFQMQEAAKKTASSDQWKCDDKTEKIVLATVIKVRKLNSIIAELDKLKANKKK